MTDNVESVTIAFCPFCKRKHTYEIRVERSKRKTNKKTVPRRKTVTKAFTCPNTGEVFNCTFVLSEEADSEISSVEVIGPTKAPFPGRKAKTDTDIEEKRP